MNQRLLAAFMLMLIPATWAHAQEPADFLPFGSSATTAPADPAPPEDPETGNVAADPSVRHVIIIEATPDMERSEVILKVVKALENDGIAKTVPMNTSFVRALDFNAKILANPNLSSDLVRQVVQTLIDLKVQRVSFGMANPNGTNDIILTCPPDVTWREVRNLQEALKTYKEFKVMFASRKRNFR